MDSREHVVTSERAFEGKLVKVRVDQVRLPDGRDARREVVEHPGAVAIVPVLPGPRVVLVRQWRHAAGEVLLEIPAGTLEPDEEPVVCARRELAEETRLRAGQLRPLITFFTTPGFTEEKLYTFLATDLASSEGEADEDEFICCEDVDWDEAVAMCLDGRIHDAKTIAAILAADRFLSRDVES
ncbi:MAG: NUDIX hydrolase [Armatimonadetes bacterium]|nr:NUDIX hydrolase [Armatimonadota bacterium]